MPLQFIKSQRGHDLLIHDGFIHKRERTIGEKVIWRCNESKNCTGRAHTMQDSVIKYKEHKHVENRAKIEVKKTINKMKENAIPTIMPTRSLLAETSSKLPSEVAGQMPNPKCLKRTIQRVRNISEAVLANPQTSNFEIPDQFRLTLDGDNFLLYDSGDSDIYEDRILLFSTERNLNLLKDSEHWFSDGKFSSCPNLFYQFYTIHSVFHSDIIPLVYVLLPDKKEITYKKLFQELKSLKPDLCPKSFMVDFEKAVMNAIKNEFPHTKIHGCFFHLSQAVWRQIQHHGLAKQYSDDVKFSLEVRKLAALAFVPVDKVIESFELLLESTYYIENEQMLSPLITYFEGTWIGILDRRGNRRPPLFSIEIWNCYDRLQESLPRTNNKIEVA
ncbi:unnamed protein product [Macrosiphum euphorbiae]|uniref:MULE transposase domain-containing protein n=1 Tax=Macrosiphum euphorbiae TaxID=13131 RepID=A0AAV0XM34_9HEMI|nr:unnamed protein product [Macrosiphum euphorbiae]